MKKLILILLVLASVATVSAQTTFKSTAYPANSLDTVTNSGTKTIISQKVGFGRVGQVQFTATKISGTIAGTATLQGSLDGTNWYIIGSAFTLTDVAAQTTSWKVLEVGEVYFQISVTGTGTMSTKIAGKYTVR